MAEVEALVNELATKFRKRKVEGSGETARLTAELFRTVISHQRVTSAVLVEVIRDVGQKLIAANPVELAVGNIVRRVLRIIRDSDTSLEVEGLTLIPQGDDGDIVEEDDKPFKLSDAISQTIVLPPSLVAQLESKPNLVRHFEGKAADKTLLRWQFKHQIIEEVNDLIEDINTCHESIADQALELIHQNEVILTLGHSRTVKNFLYAATEKKRSFQVYVAEGAPKHLGLVLANELAEKHLQITVIPDASVFAMISRVNMVIVGVHAVMANGGIMAPVGMNMLALAAKRHAVPFVVVAGTHKLCPLFPNNPEVLLNDMRSPSELLSFGDFSDCMDFSVGSGAPLLHVVNPAFDYVPPELVSLFVTEIGGYHPSYIYRLVSDYYSADDIVLHQKPAS
ncbi:uncharacterized protein LOC126789916 [Argentina anserina]|uniref:uncharacterized protein LOC126789916 n=1 Tax=Argentina anserina TaxID=57926 RepID=UPI0021768622|nr:uncharacterized protein LOC126789916 [Potentilla anserina]